MRISILSSGGSGWAGRPRRPFRGGQQTFTLQLLPRQLARTPHCLGMLAHTLLRRLLIMGMRLGFAKDAFALHLLLQHTQCLVDIVVSYEYLQKTSPVLATPEWRRFKFYFYFLVLIAAGLNHGSCPLFKVGAGGTCLEAADFSTSISLAEMRRSKPSTSERALYCA
jgi:hypothetical protein